MTDRPGHDDDDPHVFRLLFVCSGNVCRSPFAELATRQLLAERHRRPGPAPFAVSSAGHRALAGSPMHPTTRADLHRRGLDHGADRFVARQLVPGLVERADLVLGMAPQHRAAAVACAPGALATAFGLREFARLAATVDADLLPADPLDRARALVGRARAGRGLTPPVDPGEDEVPDPIGRPEQAHRVAAYLVLDAVRAIVAVLAPARG